MPKKRVVKFTVIAELPMTCSDADLRAYLEDAVFTMRGCYQPDDPIQEVKFRLVKTYKKPIEFRVISATGEVL